jgi:hypothetical protein
LVRSTQIAASNAIAPIRAHLTFHDNMAVFTPPITLPQPGAARRGQKTPDGYYNLERMLKRATAPPNRVLLCGTCMDARGLGDADVVEGAANSTMEELASETLAADRTVVF